MMAAVGTDLTDSPLAAPAEHIAAARTDRLWLSAVPLVLLAVAAYANSFNGEFVFDDQIDIVNTFTGRPVWPLWGVLLRRDDAGLHLHPRPVVALTYALNYAWGGLAPRGFHVTNLLIHILAGLTLFGIVRRTLLLPRMASYASLATPLAWLVAALWTVHPLQTQAVTYIVQRYESLMGLFYLFSCYSGLRAMTSNRLWPWGAGSVAACALAMGSKEVAVSLPLVLLLYDRTFVADSLVTALRRRWALYAALARMLAGIFALLSRLFRRGHLALGRFRHQDAVV